MKKTTFLFIFFFGAFNAFAQTNYTGFIDKYPIEFVLNAYSDGETSAIYAYTNFDNPIVIEGTLEKSNLTLFEKDNKGNNSASLIFNQFDPKSQQLEGTWKDLKTQKELKITLKKAFQLDDENEKEWKNREIIQPVSIDNKYFKIVLAKTADEYYAKVVGVKVLEKKTDKLLQKFDVDCQLWGLNNLSVEDFNFDGVKDFSVFESSYAGANTSSLYFLCDPATKKYSKSSFAGISLEFDSKTKKITEHNQCCGGQQLQTIIYKVVNNKMVVLEKHCFRYDEKKQDFVERKLKDCE
jgi:hypothetical protein